MSSLKEIRERHNVAEKRRLSSIKVLPPIQYQRDRGELLNMVDKLQTQVDAVRSGMLGNECQNTYGKQNKPCGMCLFCSIQQALKDKEQQP